jgi:hypothetical protein
MGQHPGRAVEPGLPVASRQPESSLSWKQSPRKVRQTCRAARTRAARGEPRFAVQPGGQDRQSRRLRFPVRIVEENWKVLASLFPTGWQQIAWQSGAVVRLRGFPSPDVLLRMLMLHVAWGYSLRETVVRAKLANWTDISDVALLKRLRNSEEWLRLSLADHSMNGFRRYGIFACGSPAKR